MITKNLFVNYLEIFQLINQKRTLGTIYLVFNIENLKVYCFIRWLIKIRIKTNDLEKDIRISLPVSWPMTMTHMHHIPICFFLCSSSLVLSSRLFFASAIVLLPFIGFWLGEDLKAVYGREYIWIEFVCVRHSFSLHCFGVHVVSLFLFIIKESILPTGRDLYYVWWISENCFQLSCADFIIINIIWKILRVKLYL